MTRYVLKRLIYAVFVIFCVVTIVFFLTRLSGDPARLMAALIGISGNPFIL